MKVMVVGSGGREHALAWKLAQSPKVQKVYVAPGNGGTADDDAFENVPFSDPAKLADFAGLMNIALTVIGPEVPLAAGIVDMFRDRSLRVFGPTQAAAQLESSKSFAKDFMQRHGIPTALYAEFSQAAPAHAHVDEQGAPIVIKADGLAAGKGVVVAMTVEEAHAAIDFMLPEASVGAKVVIEEFMPGEEASFIVVSDGDKALALATSQDHKRIGDGDTGPNTGGMGAYSPAPVVTPEVHARVMREIIQPTIKCMAADGIAFTGFLYAGLMIDTKGKARVVEFNARLGDPEAQVLLMRLKSDLFDVLMAATSEEGLGELHLDWDRRTALVVVMAAAGYPGAVRSGDVISGLTQPAPADTVVFHAGTELSAQGDVLTKGGRVLGVAALGDTVKAAQQRAYALADGIRFAGAQMRRDIGHRALKAR
jgi:phosphoribosylamine---glycine ligase